MSRFTFGASQGGIGASQVSMTEFHPVIAPEVLFSKVAMKVLFVAALVDVGWDNVPKLSL